MPADVIINPTSGEIYWNDNTGTPQSISIRGDAQNKIDIIGYGASFSPGGSGTGTFVIATFNDSIVLGQSAFVPGTSGNDIGSATLRWKSFLTTTNISDSSASLGTNTTSLLSGVIQVNGGIAISGNASIGQSVLFFNKSNPIYFVGLSAPASLASTTTYFLPTAYPGSGTSVLQSDTTGNLTWVQLPTTGTVTVAANGNSSVFLLGSNLATGSGLAVSANSSLFYNSATQTLTTPFLYASYSSGSEGGEIVFNKPASGSGLTTTITVDIQADRFRIFETGGANRGFYLDFVDSISGAGRNIIGSASLATTSQTVQVSLVGNPISQHSILLTPSVSSSGSAVSGNGTLVYNPSTDILTSPGIAVSSGVNATSTTSGAFQVRGGAGITGNAFIGGTINVASPITIPNGGTNVASFGQSAGFIYYDGVNIRLLAATGATINFTNGYYQFDNRVYATAFFGGGTQMPNGSGGAGRVTYWSGNNTIASNTNFLWDNTNNIVTVLGNFNGIGLTASGLAVTSALNATSTTSAALTVTGGVAIGQSISLAGRLQLFSGANYTAFVSAASASTTYTLPALTPAGTAVSVLQSTHEGVLSWVPMVSAGTATTAQNVQVTLVGNPISQHSVLLTPTVSSAGSAISGNGTLVYNPSTDILTTPGLAVTSATNATSTSTGSLRIFGGVGITGNAFIGGTFYSTSTGWFNNNTFSTATNTGALVVTGGLGLVGNAFIGGTVTLTNTTQSAYGSSTSGAVVVAGSVGIGGSVYIGGQLGVGGTLDYLASGNVAYFSGNNNSYTQVVVHNHNAGNSASSDFIVSNDSATDTTFFGDFGMNSSGWAATTAPYNTANAVYLVSNSGDLAIGSLTSNAIRFFFNNGTSDSVAMGGSGMTVFYGTTSTSTTSGALQVRGGIGITGNAFIGGTLYSSSTAWIDNSTTSISSATGALIVTGGVGIGGSLNLTTAVPSSISGLYVFNGVLSGTALTAPSMTVTNLRTTVSTLNIVDSQAAATVLNYNGSRFGVLLAVNSTASNNGGLVVTGGAGFGATINVAGNVGARSGFELRAFDSTDANYTGFRFTGAASTTYILPTTSPATGSSVLSSTAGGVMSWVPMATGSGSPVGNNTELQFNNGGTFGGATGITYQSTTYLVSIASTADQRAVTTVGLRLVNNATVSVSAQQRYSPALEITGKTWTSPASEYFNRFVTEVFGTIGFYAAQQQWKYSYDTGTPSYSNPVFIIHSQKGVGIGRSNITFQSFFVANASQAAELTYVLPVAYPGTGTSVLSSDTTGNLSWVPMTTGGSGTPGGSNRQIQFNNSSTFGGAAGFEYVSAGNAVTVNIFATAGGGLTSGLSINTINGTTTRIGIGLTNPAFELEILGEISATNKSFVIDHPTKPGMKLRYGSLEGPENGVYVRGQLLGSNVIVTPDHWKGLVHDDSFTVHLTPIGAYQHLYVDKIENYNVYVGTASTFEINCYYSVWAERKDIPKLTVEY